MRNVLKTGAALILIAGAAFAHDIPSDVTIQEFIRPDPGRLDLLIRVPLKAMRDIEFPQRDAGYLDLARTAPILRDAAEIWIARGITLWENERPLAHPTVKAAHLSLVSDISFRSFDSALAHTVGPEVPPDTNVVWDQMLLDILLEYRIDSEHSRFSIQSNLARLGLRVVTVLRYILPDGAVRPFEFTGDPGKVDLDPGWLQAAGRFVELGFFHILDGADHLLFLCALVIPLRRLRSLIPVVTAFTIAHSITLIASAYNLAPDALWFPPLVEALIAASIVYTALENIVIFAEGRTIAAARRWPIAFGFGLVHGFGFSFVLRETMQFAGSHLLASLLSFNVGVELGQILVLIVLVAVCELLFRFTFTEPVGVIVLSALVAHTGWDWMIERGAQLRRFHIELPEWNLATLALLARWLLLTVAFGAAWWMARAWKSPGRTRANRE